VASGRSPGEDRDPLEAVLAIGGHAGWVVLIALGVALAFHGAAGVRAALIDPWLLQWAGKTGLAIDNHMQQTFDVDTTKDEPPPPPPPPEEQKEKDEPEARKDINPYEDVPPPPPAAAQAGKVLTDDSDVADFTGQGFVQGTNDAYVGGRTMAAGTGTAPVRAPAVTTGPAGTGTTQAPPPPPPIDRSRPLTLGGSGDWSCGFPPEADADQIDDAYATVEITAGPDGRAQKVTIKTDPGHGFGVHAKQCAMRQSFTPALDRDGRPTTATKSFRIHFER
jgi:protein TonB